MNSHKISPRYAEAYTNRGIARHYKGDLEGAIADYNQAIRLNPKLVEAYANRGFVRKAKGDLEAAIADFKKALQLAPAGWPHRGLVERSLRQTEQGTEKAQGGQVEKLIRAVFDGPFAPQQSAIEKPPSCRRSSG